MGRLNVTVFKIAADWFKSIIIIHVSAKHRLSYTNRTTFAQNDKRMTNALRFHNERQAEKSAICFEANNEQKKWNHPMRWCKIQSFIDTHLKLEFPMNARRSVAWLNRWCGSTADKKFRINLFKLERSERKKIAWNPCSTTMEHNTSAPKFRGTYELNIN